MLHICVEKLPHGTFLLIVGCRAREMAQWFKAFAVIIENLGLVASTPSTHSLHIYMQAPIHTHKTVLKNNKICDLLSTSQIKDVAEQLRLTL